MRLGVCSWSLQAASPRQLAERVESLGLRWLHLALDPIQDGVWGLEEVRRSLADRGIGIVSGMIGTIGEDYSSLESIRDTGGLRPDRHWEANLARARRSVELARDLGLELVTFHAGFIPHASEDPEKAKMIGRLRTFADLFGDAGLRLGLETGQETAETLEEVLREVDRLNLGVNFDPANMILYGMGDPIAALRRLARQVWQIHVKDALPTGQPGTWGTEVTVGTGAVDWKALHSVCLDKDVPLEFMIEREAGTDRLGDVLRAKSLIRGYFGDDD